MTNEDYLNANVSSFQRYICNNFNEFKKDKSFMLDGLKYYAHCFSAGIKKDGTENGIILSSYSAVLIRGLFETSLGIPVDAKTWNGWICERLGAAYS